MTAKKFEEPTEESIHERTVKKQEWLQRCANLNTEEGPKEVTYEEARQQVMGEIAFARRFHRRAAAYRKIHGRDRSFSVMGQGR